MDGSEILAAYLADHLLQAGLGVINQGSEIMLVTPMTSVGGLFIFHKSVMEKIKNKNVVIIVASMTTGDTANRVMECLSYYGCKVVGISAVFSAFPEVSGRKIHSIFDSTDIPNYCFYQPSECPMCREGRKIDAIITSEGYSKI
jgi:orotate phosphoribosyltransferase